MLRLSGILSAIAALVLVSCSGTGSDPVQVVGAQAAAKAELFDTHGHFYSDDFAKFPLTGSGLYAGVERIQRRASEHPRTPENTLPLWDANNITGGSGVQYFTAYGYDNSFTLYAADYDPARISGVIILNARDPNTPAELRRLATEHNVKGLRITGFADEDGGFGWLDSDAALQTWQAASDVGVAMVVMLGRTQDPAEGARRIGALAAKFPEIAIVLDHVGQPPVEGAPDFGISKSFAALAEHPNVFYKFTQINIERLREGGVSPEQFVRHIVDLFGADQLMWGSDFGNTEGELSAMVNDAIAATSLLTPEEQQKALHDTGYRIFSRSGRGAAE